MKPGFKPKIKFVVKAVFASALLMFLSMAAGELIVDPELFRGFTKSPYLWLMIFLETSIAVFPLCLLGLGILSLLKFRSQKRFLLVAATVWFTLFCVVLLVYRFFFTLRVSKILDWEPGLFFGWFLPCALIAICFIQFSKELYDPKAGI